MIVTWSKGADDYMPQELLVRTLQIVRRHPWWLARGILAVDALQREGIKLPANILDVGCGWGTNLDALEKAGYKTTGLDISRQILEAIDRPERKLIEADLTQDLPSGAGQFDGFLALDVIEHLDDDGAAVRRMGALLRPGGIGVISVPARPDLFSEFDEVQGHRRRYLPESLREAVTGSGLEIRRIFWWGQWMVPVLRRMRGKRTASSPGKPAKTYAEYLRLPPWPGPLVMKSLYKLEHSRALNGWLQTGTSLFAVVTRKK
jgi:SAM-dependent methyltransferase